MTSNPSFNKHTTATEVAAALKDHIKGKIVLITGPSPGGLGCETAKAIATQSPGLIILAGRDPRKMKEAEDQVHQVNPVANTRILVLDLGSLTQIKEAAAEVLAYPDPIDVLINNAGIMAGPYRQTSDGHEAQFGTNHLGHFAFTTSILPKVLASKSPRIVNVTSMGHAFGGIRWEDPDWKQGEYNPWAAYGQAKTANILFSIGLVAHYGSQGLVSLALHPGNIPTPLLKFSTDEDRAAFRKSHGAYNEDGTPDLASGVWKTLAEGAATHLVAGFDPLLAKHCPCYMVDCQVANDQCQAYALNEDDAEKLWTLSQRLIAGATQCSLETE